MTRIALLKTSLMWAGVAGATVFTTVAELPAQDQSKPVPIRIVNRPLNAGGERIYSALDRKVDFMFTGQTLDEVMKFLATHENITIVIDEKTLKNAGLRLDTEINLVVKNVSFQSALDMMLADVNGVRLDYIVADEMMTITTAAIADSTLETWIYDLRGVGSSTPEKVSQILKTTVAPESWAGQGGKASAIPLQGGVLINQSQRNHRKIASSVQMLTQYSQVDLWPTGNLKFPTAFHPPAIDPRTYALTGRPMLIPVERPEVVDFRRISDMEARILSALTKKVDLQFTGQELQEAMKFFATQEAINVKIDTVALKEASVPLDAEINLVASGLTLGDALALMFKDVGGKQLDFVIENEALVVTTAERGKATRETRIYDVRGITSDPQQVVPLLSRWCTAEDAKAADGALVITTSQPDHREILPFLELLTEFRQRRAAADDRQKAKAEQPAKR